jgi:hypothetical protein
LSFQWRAQTYVVTCESPHSVIVSVVWERCVIMAFLLDFFFMARQPLIGQGFLVVET